MKSIALKIGKFSLSILLCIIILINSMIMFIVPAKELAKNTEEKQNVEIAKEINVQEKILPEIPYGIKVTSRSGDNLEPVVTEEIKQEPVKYTIYEMVINNSKKLYFEDLGLLNKKMEYLLNNTKNVNVIVNELSLEDKELLNTEGYVDKVIQNYINNYPKKPKITTCFPTSSHRVSSSYGQRASRGDFHTGIDLCGNCGDPIYAYKSGKVIKTQYSNKSYGNMILIEHSDKSQTRYAHLSSISVTVGQSVECGQLIGRMGSTGNSTGNHLHFEIIINGKTVNPYSYIF